MKSEAELMQLAQRAVGGDLGALEDFYAAVRRKHARHARSSPILEDPTPNPALADDEFSDRAVPAYWRRRISKLVDRAFGIRGPDPRTPRAPDGGAITWRMIASRCEACWTYHPGAGHGLMEAFRWCLRQRGLEFPPEGKCQSGRHARRVDKAAKRR